MDVEFDALPWFQQASPYQIAALAAKEFKGDYEADAVAEFCETHDPGLKRLFTYLGALNSPGDIKSGFEVYVDSDAAMAWLKKRDEHRAGINPNSQLRYAHTLQDGEPGCEGGICEVIIEADTGWASIGVFNADGEHVGDVTVEVRKNMVTARIWKQDDIHNDPTAKVDMCVNPQRVLDWVIRTKGVDNAIIEEWVIEKRLEHEVRAAVDEDARLKASGVTHFEIEVSLRQK